MGEIEGVGTVGLVCWRMLRVCCQSFPLPVWCGDLIEVGVLVKESWVRGWSGQYLTAREPSWQQDGLPPIVNIM